LRRNEAANLQLEAADVGEIVIRLHPQLVSAVLPIAFSRRTAISGVMLLRPEMTL
jgi:hypothetical protein